MALVAALSRSYRIGFNIKMLEAYLVVPAYGLLYLLAAPHSIWKRVGHLAVAGALLLVISLSWAVAVDLTPASQRPYVGSTQNNSEISLALGYNGIQRLLGGMGGGPGGGTPPSGAPPSTNTGGTGTSTAPTPLPLLAMVGRPALEGMEQGNSRPQAGRVAGVVDSSISGLLAHCVSLPTPGRTDRLALAFSSPGSRSARLTRRGYATASLPSGTRGSDDYASRATISNNRCCCGACGCSRWASSLASRASSTSTT